MYVPLIFMIPSGLLAIFLAFAAIKTFQTLTLSNIFKNKYRFLVILSIVEVFCALTFLTGVFFYK